MSAPSVSSRSSDDQNTWLVVIDMQVVFADPASPWATPGFASLVPTVRELIRMFGPRVAYTRFVAPETPIGAWVPYYANWPFALVPARDPLYDVVEELEVGEHPVVTRTTFGKWDTELADLVGADGRMVLVGVSTDCCVLSTALAAADAGVAVTVVADACAGVSEADHHRALDAMAMYAPLIEIVPASSLLSG